MSDEQLDSEELVKYVRQLLQEVVDDQLAKSHHRTKVGQQPYLVIDRLVRSSVLLDKIARHVAAGLERNPCPKCGHGG